MSSELLYKAAVYNNLFVGILSGKGKESRHYLSYLSPLCPAYDYRDLYRSLRYFSLRPPVSHE